MENEVRSSVKNGSFDFKAIIMGCLNFIISVMLKPVSTLKEKIKDYSDFKSAGILVLFISIARVLINLISNMISVIFVKQTNYFSGKTKLEVSFDNLSNLDYFDLIVKQLFWSIVIVAAVAGIYYVVSMIMKKNANYFRLCTICAVSFVPVCVVSLISVIVNYIYVPLSAFIVFAAFIYSFLIFIHAIDNEVEFKDVDYKVFFHTICLTVVFIVSYYVLTNMLDTMFTSLLK